MPFKGFGRGLRPPFQQKAKEGRQQGMLYWRQAAERRPTTSASRQRPVPPVDREAGVEALRNGG